jgi:hypothetical protein
MCIRQPLSALGENGFQSGRGLGSAEWTKSCWKTWENERNRFPAAVYAVLETPSGKGGRSLPSGSSTRRDTVRCAKEGTSMVRKSATGRIGIADVAIKAGVSHATVSRVMNGNFTVDPDIAARVRAAAAELKYQPNPVGRSLALGKTDTIGIVVPDLANPTFQAILRGLSRAAAQDSYRVLIADSFEVSSEEAILAGAVTASSSAHPA